jgi:DNA topoisomerase VI subunit B
MTKTPRNGAVREGHRLERVTFRTSREMDFFTEKALISQTGHEPDEWPFVIVKELLDNALDACEEAGVPPCVAVAADAAGITVTDNGPGLPEETLHGAMDFSVRVSSREAYVSPCRGAQGNALKTLLPMPWVMDPQHGRLAMTAGGRRHEIRCGVDPISQRVVINDEVEEAGGQGGGTIVRLSWSPRQISDHEPLWPFGRGVEPLEPDDSYRPPFAETFRILVEGFAVFNPHATVRLDWFGEETVWPATRPDWEKWKPHQPTSAHWYERRHLERLLGAYITHDRDAGRDRLVSDFLAEFDGLKGSAKRTKVLDGAGMKRTRLSELVNGDRLDGDRVARLLAAMQGATRPVSPERLGVIGEAHLKARLLAMGVREESFKYSRRLAKDGLPGVLESAFGWLGKSARDRRKIHTGANWSSAIGNPFRSFGSNGEGLETMLAQMRVTSTEPVVFVLHLACPRVEYKDSGKSALVVGGGALDGEDEWPGDDE